MTKKNTNRKKRSYKLTKRNNYTKKPVQYKFQMLNTGTNRFVTLKYTARLNLNPDGIGMQVSQAFKANCIQDVDSALSGAAPIGYNTMFSQYESCYVQYSTIKVTAYGNESLVATSRPNICCLYQTDTVPSVGQPLTVYIAQNNLKRSIVQNSYAVKPTIMKNTYNPKKRYGYKDVADADDLTHTKETDPVKNMYWFILCDSLFQNENNNSTDFLVEIWYNCVFNGQIRQAA